MDPSASRQQIIDYIQTKKANFSVFAVNMRFSLVFYNNQNKEHYRFPVNTVNCRHEKTQELDQILSSKQCAICRLTFDSYKNLVMDIRWAARLIMHPDIEFISIIKGQIFHEYTRGKSYYEFFNQQKYQQLIGDLFDNHHTKNDFMQIAQNETLYTNAKATDQLHYDAICQLDFVKIQIPVRHKDCKHVGCYELTSLLAYRKEILDSKPHTKHIECLGKCQVKIDLNRLEQDLVLDQQLLSAIRKSRPHSIKFYINQQTNQLIDEHQKNNNQDLYIRELYKQKIKNINEQDYQKFENQLFGILKDIYSTKLSDLSRTEGKNVYAQSKLYEFQNQTLKLEDPFLKTLPVEYPVRCINCNFAVCSDIRTYIADFLLKGLQSPQNLFQCQLCSKTYKKSYEQIITSSTLNLYIYLDHNLLKRLLEHREYIHTKKFTYEGCQYMLDEFKKRHKIFASDEKEQYKDKNILYDNLNCIVSNKRLTVPLQLINCPKKNYVDFYVFYDELTKINYDFSKGLALCKCQGCATNPIKSTNDIFFHEFLQIALDKLKKYENFSKTQQSSVTIDATTEGINYYYEENQQPINSSKILVRNTETKPRPGFAQLWTDEQFQNCQEFFKYNGQYKARVNKITQNIGGINIEVTEKGDSCDIDQKQQSMNQAAQTDKFKKYNIKVSGLTVTVKNDDLKFNNEMKFSAKQ